MADESETPKLELFHRIADAGSAEARRLVVELELVDAVRMRNLTYDEVQADFTQRGGRTAPAVWDGARLVEGVDAVRAALEAAARRR